MLDIDIQRVNQIYEDAYPQKPERRAMPVKEQKEESDRYSKALDKMSRTIWRNGDYRWRSHSETLSAYRELLKANTTWKNNCMSIECNEDGAPLDQELPDHPELVERLRREGFEEPFHRYNSLDNRDEACRLRNLLGEYFKDFYMKDLGDRWRDTFAYENGVGDWRVVVWWEDMDREFAELYGDTVARMNESSFQHFLEAAKNAVKAGRIAEPDGVFITEKTLI